MQQTNVPFKVALGYIIVAIVLILAIGLVYRNTTTVLAINQATQIGRASCRERVLAMV